MNARVGLCMIVKNESHVIKRCLDSVLPFIDTWTVVDTGSTDGTQEVIQDVLGHLPGTLHERPWVNFGHNRNEAVELARPAADYTLIIDADEVLETPEGFSWPELTGDGYPLTMTSGSYTYRLVRLIANRLPWTYVGSIHEYIHCDGAKDDFSLAELKITGHFDGGRNTGLTTAQKYAREAAEFEELIAAEPDNPRYHYYLGRSYRLAEEWQKALAAFRQRATMGGWEEEVFDSLLTIARLYEQTDAPSHAVVTAYLDAFEYRPSRAEPLHHLACYLRRHDRWALARVYAAQAAAIPRPADEVLWVEDDIYTWRSRDELAVASSWTGHLEEAAAVSRDLLEVEELPDEDRKRIQANLELFETQLAERAAAR